MLVLLLARLALPLTPDIGSGEIEPQDTSDIIFSQSPDDSWDEFYEESALDYLEYLRQIL